MLCGYGAGNNRGHFRLRGAFDKFVGKNKVILGSDVVCWFCLGLTRLCMTPLLVGIWLIFSLRTGFHGRESAGSIHGVNGSLATRRHMSRMIHSTSDRFSRQTVSTDLDESRLYTQMPTGSNRRLSGASFIRELSLADDDTPALSQNFNLKPPGIHNSGVTCHARHWGWYIYIYIYIYI